MVLPLLAPTLVAVALVILPGLAITLSLGLRGSTALIWAGPSSVAVIAASAFLTGVTPMRWGLVPVVLVTAVSTLIAIGLRVLSHRLDPAAPRGQWRGPREYAAYAGLAVAAILLTATILRVLGRPDAFSQTWDNYFHLNLIRTFLDTGNASPLVLSDFGDVHGPRTFYPSAFHAFVALVSVMGGAEITVATNAVTITIAAVLWPLSVVGFARIITESPLTLVGAGVAAASFPTFPLLPIEFGVLYAYLLGVALLLFAVALSYVAFGFAPKIRIPWPTLVALLGISVGAIGLSHPNALLVWMAINLVVAAAALVRDVVQKLRGHSTHVVRYGVALVVITVATKLAWDALRPGYSEWPVTDTLASSLGEFLTGTIGDRGPAIIMAALAVLGFAAIARSPGKSYLLAPALAIYTLWYAASVLNDAALREWLVGGFYRDPNRLASVFPVALLPLVFAAFDAIGRQLRKVEHRGVRLATAAALVAIVAAMGQKVGGVPRETVNAAEEFAVTEDSPNVTPDELTMIRELPDHITRDDVVLTDPRTGGGLIYALEGLTPILYHGNDVPTPEEEILLWGFSDRSRQAEVCDAVHATGVTHVLDFGTDQVNMHLEQIDYRGLRNLDRSPLVTLVHEVGDTRLYEVTGCGQ